MAVIALYSIIRISTYDLTRFTGHTARPSDFCWAPGEAETWTAASTSEDNVVMVWQPTMRVWAGDEVRVDERELEGDAMEGIESTNNGDTLSARERSAAGSGTQSMSMSASVSVSGADMEDDS
jgi:histone-binding protein RBBP4